MRNITGAPVRGDGFFPRHNLVRKLWELLLGGNHVLIAAPRRVGKTSLMYSMVRTFRAAPSNCGCNGRRCAAADPQLSEG